MIHLAGPAEGAVARLLAALVARGLVLAEGAAPDFDGGSTLLLSTPVDWMKLGVRFAPWRVARAARVVVVSRVGAHPDAVSAGLRDLWRLEEYARVSAVPTLTLRLAPLVGRESPFWRQLASRPKLRDEARAVLMPVLETDALAALDRVLQKPDANEGWYEVVGPEARSLEEWAELAAASGTAPGGSWEPELAELAEHRLSEPALWQERFHLKAHSVVQWARGA